jgi:hypothetical protein
VNTSASILTGELPEESAQFRFFLTSRLAHLKGSVGLIVAKDSRMRVTIPIDLSTRAFIPLPRFFNSRREPHLLTYSFSSLIYGTICLSDTWCTLILKDLSAGLTVHHSSDVTFVHLDLSFFYSDVKSEGSVQIHQTTTTTIPRVFSWGEANYRWKEN